MCGIAGAVALHGEPIDPNRLIAMTDALAHRGPDGEGAVFIGASGKASPYRELDAKRIAAQSEPARIALGHRRLSIIDLSERGAQPMADTSGHCWITFNGELYNYVELREELAARGHRFQSSSDTEVMLHAYLEWDIDALQRFNGMFAFALWDNRKQRLLCARDHLGIKPFYYWHADGRFVFASEQKAVLAGVGGSHSPNTSAMADFLAFSYVPSTETMFQGMRRLAPGCWLTLDAGGVGSGRYWDPDFSPAADAAESQQVDRLRSLLEDSIRMQIRSDVPIGAHLSGGIDSSTVTCLAARRLPRLTTFTARFAEGGFFDETPFAKLVADHVGSDYREIVPERADLVQLLPKILYHLDEPVEAASVFGKYHVADIVSRSVKVVLGGQGGDELFGGYDWYVKSAFTALAFGAGKSVMAGPRFPFMLSTLRHESRKRLLKSLWKSRGDRRLERVFFRSWSRIAMDQIERVFQRDLYDRDYTPENRFLDAFDQLDTERAADGMFKFDMRYYLESLLTSEDRLSMAFSVESRVPLLDYRIAELAGRLGFEQKATPGCSKQLLRRAVSGIVPEEILMRRDKRGFPTPIGAWLQDPKLDLMERFVFNDNAFAARYFDLAEVRNMYRARTAYSTDWAERLWRILNLAVWGQVFELS